MTRGADGQADTGIDSDGVEGRVTTNAGNDDHDDTGNAAAEAGADRSTVLTDGVIAIALTLLALDLKPALPSSANSHELARNLFEHRTQYTAFALAFYLIAQYWLTHHRIVNTVRRASGRFLVLTLVFLFGITLAPLTTYINGNFGNSLANTLFAANIFLIGAALALMDEEIHRRRLDDRVETAQDRLMRRARSITLLVIPALVAGLAWVIGGYANLLFLLFFGASIPARLWVRHRARTT